jgi:hypothetical protein
MKKLKKYIYEKLSGLNLVDPLKGGNHKLETYVDTAKRDYRNKSKKLDKKAKG